MFKDKKVSMDPLKTFLDKKLFLLIVVLFFANSVSANWNTFQDLLKEPNFYIFLKVESNQELLVNHLIASGLFDDHKRCNKHLKQKCSDSVGCKSKSFKKDKDGSEGCIENFKLLLSTAAADMTATGNSIKLYTLFTVISEDEYLRLKWPGHILTFAENKASSICPYQHYYPHTPGYSNYPAYSYAEGNAGDFPSAPQPQSNRTSPVLYTPDDHTSLPISSTQMADTSQHRVKDYGAEEGSFKTTQHQTNSHRISDASPKVSPDAKTPAFGDVEALARFTGDIKRGSETRIKEERNNSPQGSTLEEVLEQLAGKFRSFHKNVVIKQQKNIDVKLILNAVMAAVVYENHREQLPLETESSRQFAITMMGKTEALSTSGRKDCKDGAIKCLLRPLKSNTSQGVFLLRVIALTKDKDSDFANAVKEWEQKTAICRDVYDDTQGIVNAELSDKLKPVWKAVDEYSPDRIDKTFSSLLRKKVKDTEFAQYAEAIKLDPLETSRFTDILYGKDGDSDDSDTDDDIDSLKTVLDCLNIAKYTRSISYALVVKCLAVDFLSDEHKERMDKDQTTATVLNTTGCIDPLYLHQLKAWLVNGFMPEEQLKLVVLTNGMFHPGSHRFKDIDSSTGLACSSSAPLITTNKVTAGVSCHIEQSYVMTSSTTPGSSVPSYTPRLTQTTKVLCPFHCGEQLRPQYVEAHKQLCPKAIKSCCYCFEEVRREELVAHESMICQWRLIGCQYCSAKKIVACKLDDHHRFCVKAPANCDFCKKKIPKEKMNEHHKNCFYYPVECKTCAQEFSRREYLQHQATCYDNHDFYMGGQRLTPHKKVTKEYSVWSYTTSGPVFYKQEGHEKEVYLVLNCNRWKDLEKKSEKRIDTFIGEWGKGLYELKLNYKNTDVDVVFESQCLWYENKVLPDTTAYVDLLNMDGDVLKRLECPEHSQHRINRNYIHPNRNSESNSRRVVINREELMQIIKSEEAKHQYNDSGAYIIIRMSLKSFN